MRAINIPRALEEGTERHEQGPTPCKSSQWAGMRQPSEGKPRVHATVVQCSHVVTSLAANIA